MRRREVVAGLTTSGAHAQQPGKRPRRRGDRMRRWEVVAGLGALVWSPMAVAQLRRVYRARAAQRGVKAFRCSRSGARPHACGTGRLPSRDQGRTCLRAVCASLLRSWQPLTL
jgi:hypothetical protein